MTCLTFHVSSLCRNEPMSGAAIGVGFNMTCESNSGASLITKYSSKVEKSMFPHVLKEHFMTNCLSLLDYALREELPINELHDIVLVTGRVMTADWATIVFNEQTQGTKVSFDIKAATLTASGSIWGKWSQHVSFPKRHGPLRIEPGAGGVVERDEERNQCIFIDTCRVSHRSWFLKISVWLKQPSSENQGKNESSHFWRSIFPFKLGGTTSKKSPQGASSSDRPSEISVRHFFVCWKRCYVK